MKLSKIAFGIGLMAIAYFGMFNPSSFEFLENFMSFQSIQGMFFVFLAMGLIGFSMVSDGVRNGN